MSDYMPTTEDVRRAYQEHCRDYDAIDGLATSPESYAEEFNRWRDKDRAEAQVEVLREASEALSGAEPQHLGDADEGLEFFDYGTGAEYGIDVAAAYLRIVANETAREAGIETGEQQ